MKDVGRKIALVTGGARGMGLAWAERLARDGATVILWGTNADRLRKAKSQLLGDGSNHMALAVDVSSREAVYDAARDVLNRYGKIDILINNAGIVDGAAFLETSDQVIERILSVNVLSMFWTIKAFLPGMVARNEGHIVNVASAAGFIGVPRMVAYVASKWAVIGLTESLRLEVAGMGKIGVKFSTFCPSYVDTGMFSGVQPPKLTKMLQVDAVVDRAYRAFLDDKVMIQEPYMVKGIPIMKALLPGKVFDYLCKVIGVTSSMQGWDTSQRED